MARLVKARVVHLNAEAARRVMEAGLSALLTLNLPPRSAEVADGSRDKELALLLDETVKTMEGSLQTLLEVLEERVKAPRTGPPGTEEPVSQADYEKSNSPE